jgi:hypothetical protein
MPAPPPELPPPEQVAADRRTLSLIWLAVTTGVVLLTAVMAYLVATGVGGGMEARELLFYLNAGLNVAAIAGAFAVQRGLEARLPSAGSYAEAAALIRLRAIVSIAVMEASAFFAAVAALLTGELVNLAFVVPFFAFAFLFFPGEGRYAYWLACWRRSR